MGSISSNGRESRVGYWDRSCLSQNRTGKYARFYSFSVSGTKSVHIDLRSLDDPEIDTHMYLISGSSKTATPLTYDDDGGDHDNSRIRRTLTSGTYTVEVTTSESARVGNFSLTVEVERPFAQASASQVFVSQSVSLLATPPSSKGSVSRYQWEYWTGVRWSKYGSPSTSSSRTVTYSSEGIRAFRVVATYSSGGSGTSSTISVEWVSAAHAASGPVEPDRGDTVVLTVDIAEAPSGATYQWQQRNGSRWSNYGSASASRSTTVSYSSEGTRQFRVKVRYPIKGSHRNEYSEPIHVTWGEWRIINSLAGALNTALFGSDDAIAGGVSGAAATKGNQALLSAQTRFLTCVNVGRTGDSRFLSFYDVLMAYDGAVATTVDNCEGRSSKPTTMFSSYRAGVKAELKRLQTLSAEYRDYLATPRGQRYAEGLGSESLLKLLGNVAAIGGETESGTGMNCVPSSKPSTLQKRIDALNCLVFRTPHDFWVDVTDANRETLRRTGWLGTGNWECDEVFDGPLPSCLKHDVGFHSLQKFVNTDSSELLDRTWNPRNKALADAKLWADIAEHGCESSHDNEGWVCGAGALARWVTASVYFYGVAEHNDKGWPVTTHDLDDGRSYRSTSSTSSSTTGGVSTHAFVDCEDGVPAIEDISVQRINNNDDFHIAWDHADGCVDDITIDRMSAMLRIEFDNGEAGRGAMKILGGSATKVTFAMSPWDELNPVSGTLTVRLFPDDREYGGLSYLQVFEIDEFK